MLLTALISLTLLRGSSCFRVERPYPPPTAAEVLAAIRARDEALHTMRAETRMSHQTNQGKVKATVRLMAARGGKVRFDAVSPFDTPLATLVADGREFSLIDAQKNRHFYGPASPCNIGRLIGVMLRPDDVLTVLGGLPVIIPHSSADLSWDARASAEVLKLSGDGLTQTIRLDATDRRWDLLSSEIHDPSGEVIFEIRTDRFRKVGDIRLPERIEVRQPKLDAELDVRFKQQEINIELPDAAFDLPQPEGLPSKRVECSTKLELE
jgi:outer membrane lipoprotein-sorting protein